MLFQYYFGEWQTSFALASHLTFLAFLCAVHGLVPRGGVMYLNESLRDETEIIEFILLFPLSFVCPRGAQSSLLFQMIIQHCL